MTDQAKANTDRELYREDTGDTAGSYYENSVFVTEQGGIGMNVGGRVVVLPIAEWHKLAWTDATDPVETNEQPSESFTSQRASSSPQPVENSWLDDIVFRCFAQGQYWGTAQDGKLDPDYKPENPIDRGEANRLILARIDAIVDEVIGENVPVRPRANPDWSYMDNRIDASNKLKAEQHQRYQNIRGRL